MEHDIEESTPSELFKAEYVKCAEARFDEALKGIRLRLNYDRSTYYPNFKATEQTRLHDAKVRKLTRLLLTCDESILCSVLSGNEYGFDFETFGYRFDEYGPGICELMEFIDFFVGHEILDDGIPGLGYYRRVIFEPENTDGPFLLCDKSHGDAEPYFCRDIEWLRERFPQAETLNLDNAISAIHLHIKRKAANLATMRAMGIFSEDELLCYEGRKHHPRMVALADELTEV